MSVHLVRMPWFAALAICMACGHTTTGTLPEDGGVRDLAPVTPIDVLFVVPGQIDQGALFSATLGATPAVEVATADVATLSPDRKRVLVGGGIEPASGGKLAPLDAISGGWSPDAVRFAFEANGDTGVKLYIGDADGGHPVQVFDSAGGGIGPIEWSHDGERVAFAISDGIVVAARATAKGNLAYRIALRPLAPQTVFDLRWTPDGSRLALQTPDGTSIVAADGASAPITLTSSQGAFSYGWSSDSSQYALCIPNVGIVATSGGLVSTPYDGGVPSTIQGVDGANAVLLSHQCSGTQWSPVAPVLAFVDGNALDVFTAGNTGATTLVDSRVDSVWGWSPDGSKILCHSNERNEDFVVDAMSGRIDADYPALPRFNRQSTRLFVHDTQTGAFMTAASDGADPHRDFPPYVLSATWLDDGEHVAIITSHGGFFANADGSELTPFWTNPTDAGLPFPNNAPYVVAPL